MSEAIAQRVHLKILNAARYELAAFSLVVKHSIILTTSVIRAIVTVYDKA